MPELGLAISSRAGFAPAAYGRYAREAEEAGFTAVFATETGSDALALAHAMVPTTTDARIGTAIANLYLRHPALMAMTAAAIDADAGGRFVLGLGTSNPTFNHETLDLPETPPLATVQEYIDVVHAVLEGGRTDHSGDLYAVQGLELYREPDRPVPVHLGALQPDMQALGARRADGVILHLSSPESAAASIEHIRRTCREADRDPNSVEISCMIPCCISEDRSAALEAAKTTILRYARHPSASRVFAQTGRVEELAAVADALDDGDEDGARRRVSRGLADSFVVHGPPGAARDQVDAFRDAGVEVPILFPMPGPSWGWDEAVRAAINVAAPTASAPPGRD